MLEFRKTRELEDDPPASFDEGTGQWVSRAEAEERLARLLENISPSEEVRLSALRFLSFGIEVADQERDTAWYVKETGRGLRLMTGRLLALSVSRLRARIGVVGPITESVRQALSIDAENDAEVKFVLGGLLLTVPLDRLGEAHELLFENFSAYVAAAMARVRRAVNLDEHSPEAISVLAKLVGRELPQPIPERMRWMAPAHGI